MNDTLALPAWQIRAEARMEQHTLEQRLAECGRSLKHFTLDLASMVPTRLAAGGRIHGKQ